MGWTNGYSANNFYPFGMIMPERNFNSTDYRYSGAGGQEKTDEISGSGNHTTAMYWEYDTRLGRRWNLDPKYRASESRYAVNGNNPILFTDPNGDFKTKFGAWLYKATHGGEIGGKKGEYFVNKSTVENGEVVIRPWVYDFQGSTKPYSSSGWGHGLRSFFGAAAGVNNDVNNVAGAGVLSQLQYSQGNITGQALEKIKQDPAMQKFEQSVIDKAKADPNYKGEKQPIEFGGKRGSLNPLDPSSADTWKVACNELTWLVRHANVEATVTRTAEGAMNISYQLTDQFDLRPQTGRNGAYNAVNSTVGSVYHDVVGGNDKLQLNATWSTQVK